MRRSAALMSAFQPRETRAYKGYLIRYNTLRGLAWVEKDGVHIGSKEGMADWDHAETWGKAAVDELTDEFSF